jgi:uncharacterized protein (TIGR03437 family)
MSSLSLSLLAVALACASADAAVLAPVPTPPQPSLPVVGLEANQGQAAAGILFLSPGNPSIAVSAQSIFYSPLGISLSLVASNPNPTVSFSDPLPGLVNSYTGSNPQKWVTGIPRYGTATLTAVYPGIDAHYTIGTNGILTLNLMLAAGVNPNAVVFQIAQASQIVLSSAGTLVASIGLPPTPLVQPPTQAYAVPFAFQSAASGPVSRTVSFDVQSTTTFGFTVQGLETTLPLEISMQLSGSGVYQSPDLAETPIEQTIDSAGNAYFAATILDPAGANVPASANYYVQFGEGCYEIIDRPVACSDVAMYKYSPSGVLDFITYLAGKNQEIAGFVGLATAGALVVAGTTNSSNFPVTAAAAQPTYAGPPGPSSPSFVGGDFFASILDPATGMLQASTYLGGPNADTMGTAAIGTDGSLYFLPVQYGSFSTEMPVTSAALLASCQSSPCTNGYVAHLSPALDKLLYGTYLPGTVQTTPELYSDGSVYYAGAAEAGFPTTPGAYQPQNAGGYDGIVARLDPTGSRLLFGTYYGGPNTDWILEMTVAPDGSVWAAVGSFVQCCVNIQNTLIHLDANGEHLLAQLPIDVSQMVVDAVGNLIALVGSPCGNIYTVLGPGGQELFATYLPLDIGGFDGADAQGIPYLDVVNSEGATTGRVQVMETQSTGPDAACVVDAASFGNQQAVSPGAIVTIFGTGLGPSQGIGFQLVNSQVPTLLGGTEVLVNGEATPILYSSSGQLNLILPYSLAVGTMPTIQVVNAGTPGNRISASVLAQGISLFQTNGSAAALNQDGTLNSPQNPAQPGSTVMLFGTGGGQTVPASVAGEVTPLVLRPLADTPQVMIPGGATLTVEWAGAAPGLVSGVTQINVELPAVIPGVAEYPVGTLPLLVTQSNFNSGTVTVSVAVN